MGVCQRIDSKILVKNISEKYNVIQELKKNIEKTKSIKQTYNTILWSSHTMENNSFFLFIYWFNICQMWHSIVQD